MRRSRTSRSPRTPARSRPVRLPAPTASPSTTSSSASRKSSATQPSTQAAAPSPATRHRGPGRSARLTVALIGATHERVGASPRPVRHDGKPTREGDAHGEVDGKVELESERGSRVESHSARSVEAECELEREVEREREAEGRHPSQGGGEGLFEVHTLEVRTLEIEAPLQAVVLVTSQAVVERAVEAPPHSDRAPERRDRARGTRRDPRYRGAGTDRAALHRATAVCRPAAGRARRDAAERG
ncbi:exported hypothetical protein [Pseudoclavibacter sp. 8L]|nr:exported hypothetical protein [Pseudoclavibacter sp. 8L]